jgi:RNA polymerase sigma factor (sigma-70 family)
MRGSGTGLPVQQLFSTKSCRILRPGADIIETMSDLELLDQYARENRQDAFSTLLDRHLRLVYSAALRQVRSPELAEEVAQSVFADLARNAGKLEQDTVLTAWLYQVTCRAAIDVVRRESRRQRREQIAVDLSTMNSNSTEWTVIEPLLDEAMEALDPPDRTAILLRYFEDKSLREVGEWLGTSEDAAQKRVSRALDQMREFFSRRGRAIGVGALAAVISANAVQSAPVGLNAAILASAAISGAGATIAGSIAITKTLAMTTVQKALIGAALATVVGTGLYEAHRASDLQQQVQALREQSVAASKQNDPLLRQLGEANRQLAELKAQNDILRRNAADLPRLRGEVGRLRDNAGSNNDPAADAAKSWIARAALLKERLQQTPGAKIPEFQYLTEQDWLNAAKNDLNSDEDYRRAFSGLRSAAENTFITSELKPALTQYQQANNGQFPSDLSQLQTYFDPPVDDSVLQRWEIGPSNTVPSVGVGAMVVTQIGAVDADYDTRYAVGPNGWGSAGPYAWDPANSPAVVLKSAVQAYMDANNGQQPTDPSQLAPYVTTPQEQAALQKAIKLQAAK